MDLFLIRHADAVPLGERGITEDSDRPLSPAGEAEANKLGEMLARRRIGFDHLLVSPFVRAQQTAAFMLRHLKPAPAMITTEALVPDAKPRKLAKVLRKLEGERFGLVGHLPHLAEWAGWLIGAKKAQLDFAKTSVASIACGEVPGKGLGVLRWLVSPDWFEG
jgi:phosphohistidine phosphatase